MSRHILKAIAFVGAGVVVMLFMYTISVSLAATRVAHSYHVILYVNLVATLSCDYFFFLLFLSNSLMFFILFRFFFLSVLIRNEP